MKEEELDFLKTTILTELSAFEYNIVGIIDKEYNIYPMTADTKVLSKIFEIKVIPYFKNIAKKLSVNGKCEIYFAKHQNQYPDITLTGGILGNNKIAIDIKSAYRISRTRFSGFTLGAFNGYFKNRDSTKNILFPYKEYTKHLILCFIYDRNLRIDITNHYHLDEVEKIPIIIENVQLILQEKWKAAITRPGSGNTANIGGINNLDDLINGRGNFVELGEDVFNDYWMHYIRKEDCNKIGLKSQPFKDKSSYSIWNKNGRPGAKEIEEYYRIHDDLNSISNE